MVSSSSLLVCCSLGTVRLPELTDAVVRAGSAFHPFKPRDERLSRETCAESNTDEQMILQVP